MVVAIEGDILAATDRRASNSHAFYRRTDKGSVNTTRERCRRGVAGIVSARVIVIAAYNSVRATGCRVAGIVGAGVTIVAALEDIGASSSRIAGVNCAGVAIVTGLAYSRTSFYGVASRGNTLISRIANDNGVSTASGRDTGIVCARVIVIAGNGSVDASSGG